MKHCIHKYTFIMKKEFYFLSIAYLFSSTALSSFLLIQQYITLDKLGKPELVGLLLAVNFLPKVFFVPIGGYIADKYSKKRLLILTTTFRILLLFLTLYLSLNNNLFIIQLYFISFSFGLLDALFIPTANACLPYLVDKIALHKANSIFTAANQLGVILGPVLLSYIIDYMSISSGLLSTTIILFICLIFISLITIKHVTRNNINSKSNSLISSIKVIKSLNFGYDLGLLASTSFFFTGVLVVLTPLLASDNFGDGAKYIGGLNATFGIGVIAFSVITQIVSLPQNITLYSATVSLSLLIVGLSQARTGYSVTPIYFLLGVIISWINVTVMTNLQRNSPKEMIGKTIAVAVFISQMCLPFSFGLISLLTNCGFSSHELTLLYGVGLMSCSTIIKFLGYSVKKQAFR